MAHSTTSRPPPSAQLSQLTLEDKISLLAGSDFWHTTPIPRLGIPKLRFSDGPNGVRGTAFFDGTAAACLPCATALAATFDRAIVYEAGALLGKEARAKGVHLLLAPTINIQRSPLGGRGFESYAEDPFLSGKMASALVNGVQDQGVGACLKHFVCNDQETARSSVSAVVDERTLREIYLMPFQVALQDCRPWSIMTAYNRVNGVHASEGPLLEILRKEWGWHGLIMSDWFGTYSVTRAIKAGLDLEMPGPTKYRGAALYASVNCGKISHEAIDASARAMLECIDKALEHGVPPDSPEREHDTPESRRLIRRLGAESMVLLKNEGVLPRRRSDRILVVGQYARLANVSGGGSASLEPYHFVTPWDGLSAVAENIDYRLGCHYHRACPLLDGQIESGGSKGCLVEYFADPDGKPVFSHIVRTTSMLMSDKLPKEVTLPCWIRASGRVHFAAGRWDFGLVVAGGQGRLYVDGKEVVDNWTSQRPGNLFFGMATEEVVGTIELTEGTHELMVFFSNHKPNLSADGLPQLGGAGAIRFGANMHLDDPDKTIADAVAASHEADAVIVIAGLTGEWESEGFDRPDMKLPGRQDDLIAALSGHPGLVVVLQSGTPVECPWTEAVPCLLQAWYQGNEAGHAMADVIFGATNPSGKLSVTMPKRLQDTPAWGNFPGEEGEVRYGEGVYVGYRWYDHREIEPLFPFGHGLSYTTWRLELIEQSVDENGTCRVETALSNTGSRDGAQVVQLYARGKGMRQLKAFTKAFVEARSTKTVVLTLDLSTLCHWSASKHAWTQETGDQVLELGFSSRDLPVKLTICNDRIVQ